MSAGRPLPRFSATRRSTRDRRFTLAVAPPSQGAPPRFEACPGRGMVCRMEGGATGARDQNGASPAAERSRIVARGPFSWAESLDVMEHFGPVARHAGSGIDPLRMTFALDGTFEPVGAAIWPVEGGLDVEIVGTRDAGRAVGQVARIFSLDHDGTGFEALGRRDPAFGALQAARPGLRAVCFTSPYECAAWAVISQRISMRQAATIQDRLILEHGTTLEVAGETVRAFPTPRRLLAIEGLAGLPAEKIERLHAVGLAALDGLLYVDRLRSLGPLEGPKALLAIRGIGPF